MRTGQGELANRCNWEDLRAHYNTSEQLRLGLATQTRRFGKPPRQTWRCSVASTLRSWSDRSLVSTQASATTSIRSPWQY